MRILRKKFLCKLEHFFYFLSFFLLFIISSFNFFLSSPLHSFSFHPGIQKRYLMYQREAEGISIQTDSPLNKSHPLKQPIQTVCSDTIFCMLCTITMLPLVLFSKYYLNKSMVLIKTSNMTRGI